MRLRVAALCLAGELGLAAALARRRMKGTGLATERERSRHGPSAHMQMPVRAALCGLTPRSGGSSWLAAT